MNISKEQVFFPN